MLYETQKEEDQTNIKSTIEIKRFVLLCLIRCEISNHECKENVGRQQTFNDTTCRFNYTRQKHYF